MPRLGFWEILLIVAIVLLIFGAKRIPELMRGLGRGAKEFKEGLHGDNSKEDNVKK
ncbi:twin-arginine translocase TatA/TatE family subunit [candidate division KSB1 bacterium]|nr:MAG: twin-arginine translocase TatA/TatE family subunit [candidate division KSB1 bacterium]